MKSPDEIKKGLVICCYDGSINKCVRCPYSDGTCGNDLNAIEKDSLALIQRLQAENAEQADRIRQLEAERDAAVDDLEDYATLKCFACKYYEMELTEAPCDECKIMGKGNRDMFEWRGVQKEATP